MTVDFSYPFNIQKDTPAVAVEVQTNFDALRTWILTNYRQKNDTPQLEVMPTLPGAPTIDQHAATKAYVDTSVPVGVMFEFGGATAPTGFLLCDGATYSTTQYPLLFAAIGRNFTPADVPSSSFRVPDRRGRVGVGRSSADSEFDAVGKTGGVKTHALTVPQMPTHRHGTNTGAPSNNTSGGSGTLTSNGSGTLTSSGESQNHTHTSGSFSAVDNGNHTHRPPGPLNSRFVSFAPSTAQVEPYTSGTPHGSLRVWTSSNWSSGTATLLDGVHGHSISGTSNSNNRSHTHTISSHTHSLQNHTHTINNEGGGEAHPNLQPYLTVNYIIRAA